MNNQVRDVQKLLQDNLLVLADVPYACTAVWHDVPVAVGACFITLSVYHVIPVTCHIVKEYPLSWIGNVIYASDQTVFLWKGDCTSLLVGSYVILGKVLVRLYVILVKYWLDRIIINLGKVLTKSYVILGDGCIKTRLPLGLYTLQEVYRDSIYDVKINPWDR